MTGLSHAVYAKLEDTLASHQLGVDGAGTDNEGGEEPPETATQGYMQRVAGNFENDLDTIRQNPDFVHTLRVACVAPFAAQFSYYVWSVQSPRVLSCKICVVGPVATGVISCKKRVKRMFIVGYFVG